MLCTLILYMTGGPYSLTSIRNDRFLRNFFMASLYILSVFSKNLLRGNRRRNIFFIFGFDAWSVIRRRTLSLISQSTTSWTILQKCKLFHRQFKLFTKNNVIDNCLLMCLNMAKSYVISVTRLIQSLTDSNISLLLIHTYSLQTRNDRLLRNSFMAGFTLSFCQKFAERKSPKKYFFSYFILMPDLGYEPGLYVK